MWKHLKLQGKTQRSPKVNWRPQNELLSQKSKSSLKSSSVGSQTPLGCSDNKADGKGIEQRCHPPCQPQEYRGRLPLNGESTVSFWILLVIGKYTTNGIRPGNSDSPDKWHPNDITENKRTNNFLKSSSLACTMSFSHVTRNTFPPVLSKSSFPPAQYCLT